jgi:hypothetical protein
MPAKQTRESIEAELNDGERERVVRKLHGVAQKALEWEKRLQEREAELGLPTFYRSKPIVERSATTKPRSITSKRGSMPSNKIVSGRQDELPDHVKNELAADADAELSGAELLAGIVQNHRKV